MPAIISAIFSAIYASLATQENYQESLIDIFPAMNAKNSSDIFQAKETVLGVSNDGGKLVSFVNTFFSRF